MKRCPQCEFLYEDDQSLCDMDGILLVYDSRQLPHLQAISTTVTQLPAKSSRKAVPALATVVLASVLGLVYYVSTQRHANQPTYTPALTTTSSAGVNANEAATTPSDSKVGETNSSESGAVKAEDTGKSEKVDSKVNPDKPSSESETPQKKPAAKPKAVPTRTIVQPAQEEKDSKVGSFFKKTGRILKKPFKL
jgi:hypothetical protein